MVTMEAYSYAWLGTAQAPIEQEMAEVEQAQGHSD